MRGTAAVEVAEEEEREREAAREREKAEAEAEAQREGVRAKEEADRAEQRREEEREGERRQRERAGQIRTAEYHFKCLVRLPSCLPPCYAVSGTVFAYGATRSHSIWCYDSATRCPILTFRMVLARPRRWS
eukprot:1376487-Rhodomonas_salina.1